MGIQGALLAGLGGFLGSAARYVLSGLAQRLFGAAFPVGTAAVNLLGCFLIGLLTNLSLRAGPLSAASRLFLVTGFLGGLTTFSTFSHETLALFEQGRLLPGLGNIALNLGAGLAAVAIGKYL